MGDRARRSDSLNSWEYPENGKRIWVRGWTKESQFFEWDVVVGAAGEYEVAVLSRGAPEIVLTAGTQQLKARPAPGHFTRTAMGRLSLPAGRSTIRVQLSADLPQGAAAAFKSLELTPVAIVSDLRNRAAALRSDTTWLREAKYGLMFQWGEWGYPRHGDRKPWPKSVEDFDIEKFADMVSEAGAGYVIWSLTWRGSKFKMPLKSVDAILPGYTLPRDFIGELADALNKRGIRLVLYYHMGHGDPRWWAAFRGSADDKRELVDNWCTVVAEIGERYGERLAGWFFDDGVIYYPAPFERMAKAAKAGNPNRFISFNNWLLPLLTEFQDVEMGEAKTGTTEIAVGGDGIYPSGPMEGQQAHGMFIIERTNRGPAWGIWQPETSISPAYSAQRLIKVIKEANSRGMPLSINVLMYEDGSVSPHTLELLRAVRTAVRGSSDK